MSSLVYDRQDAFSSMIDAEGNTLPADACEVLLNFETTRAGKVRRRKGTATQGGNLTGSGNTGLSWYRPNGAIQWVIDAAAASGDFEYAAAGGAVWTQVNLAGAVGEFATLDTGGTPTLYITCPSASPYLYSWDGTTASSVAGAPTGAQRIAAFNDRLYVAPQNSSTLYASEVAAAGWDTDQGAFTIPVTPDGDGSFIRKLLAVGDELLVLKLRSASRVRGYGEQSLVVAEGAKGASRLYGVTYPASAVVIDGERAVWLSERGLELYEGGVVRPLSERLSRNVARGLACYGAIFDPINRQYRALFDASGSVWFEYVYDFRDNSEYLRLISSLAAIDGATFALDADGLPDLTLLNDNTGDSKVPRGYFLAVEGGSVKPYVCYVPTVPGAPLLKADSATDTTTETAFGFAAATVASRALFGWLRSRPMTFGDPSRKKKVREILLDIGGTGAGTVYTRIVVDGVPGTVHTITVADAGDSRKPKTYKARVAGRGRTFQVDVWTQNDFTINGIQVGAELLGSHAK